MIALPRRSLRAHPHLSIWCLALAANLAPPLATACAAGPTPAIGATRAADQTSEALADREGRTAPSIRTTGAAHQAMCGGEAIGGAAAIPAGSAAARPAVSTAPRPSSSAGTVARPIGLALSTQQVQKLLAKLTADLPAIVARWIAIAGIPAPSGREDARASWIEKQFREVGLDEVRRDEIGNVMGVLRGKAPSGRRVVFAAHMDIVASQGDPVEILRPDSGHLQGPGARDDASGLVGLIEAARALKEMDLPPLNDIWLLATAQEEIGLFGAKKFLDDNASRVAKFVAIDGEVGDVSYGATGILWLKAHFLAPGGHTLSSGGLPSATVAAARAINAISELSVPSIPEARASWLNVSSLGGGDAVNAMARDAWFTVDIRSNSEKILTRLEAEVRGAASRAAQRTHVGLAIEELLRMPGASISALEDSPFVRLAADSLRAAGWSSPHLTTLGTADHNRAIERGIPGICIGVTTGTGMHTPDETASVSALPGGIAALAILMASLPAEP